jgi:hypothetical protein
VSSPCPTARSDSNRVTSPHPATHLSRRPTVVEVLGEFECHRAEFVVQIYRRHIDRLRLPHALFRWFSGSAEMRYWCFIAKNYNIRVKILNSNQCAHLSS